MIDPGLEGRTVLITGVNNPEGIGAATARAFASQGARLLLTYLEPEEQESAVMPEHPGEERYRWLNRLRPDPLVEELRHGGVRVDARAFDFSRDDAPEEVFRWARSEGPGIDVFISNAAVAEADSFADGDDPLRASVMDRHWTVNARFPALLIQEMARARRSGTRAGGSVVVISTDAASGHAGAASYAASKNAMESYARTAAWELGGLGLRVNVISPGPVQTGWIDDAHGARLEESIPFRRLGRPEDIADAAVFLASAQASWITGQVLFVGGGNTMR